MQKKQHHLALEGQQQRRGLESMDDQVTPVATVAEPIRMLHAPTAALARAYSDECVIATSLCSRSTGPGLQRTC